MRLFLSFFIFFWAHSSFSQVQVLATVGTKKISLEEFNKKLSEIKASTLNPPTKEQFLEDLIRFEVGVQEAQKRGLEKDPIVQDRMNQELYKALLEKELSGKIDQVKITDKEMQEYYKKNPEIRTSHILTGIKPGATPEQRAEARERANKIFAEVKASKRPFEELAKIYSDETLTKQAGGDVGWQTRVTLVPAYYEAALATKIGDIRGVVETPFGFHIIKVTGIRSFENADKRQIRAAVFDEKRRVIFNAFFDGLKKKYTIKTNAGLLGKE